MKGKNVSAEERAIREAQVKRHQSEQWLKVFLSNGHKRMMKRADYEALKSQD